MRLAWLMDVSWGSRLPLRGLRGVGTSLYILLRRVGRPAYLWGIRSGWSWLPRLRNALMRLLLGVSA
jgi:hypothetical protein